MKTIGFPTLSIKKYGGDLYTDRVKEALKYDFDVEIIPISAKHFRKHRYLKFLEFFNNLCRLQGGKDLWIRDFYSTISMLFDKTRGKNMALLFHIDFSGLPIASRPFLKILEKLFLYRALKKVDSIVVIAEYWKNFFIKKGYKNVHKIYCGFDLNDFNITDEEVLEFKKKNKLEGKPIIYIGNCQKPKGVVESYKALKDLDAYLVTSNRKQVNIPALNFNLDYRGYLTLLKSSSVVITMSKFKEGWCMTAHEAMLCRVPVVGSGLGGMKELLEGGKQIVCPNFENLKKEVEYLLQNPDLRKKMGEEGYNFVKNFTQERFNKSWLEFVKKNAEKDLNLVPSGDKGVVGERDDMLNPQESGRRGVYEHLQRYRLAARNIGANKRVLDLGCGAGYGSSILLKAGNEVFGIDISQKAVDYAKTNYPGVNYFCCPADNLPFGNDYFDAVVACEIIEHVQDPKKVLREICRVLKKGGDLFISTPNPRHLSNMLKHILLGKPYPERVVMGNIYHIKEFYYDEFINFLKEKNLEIISQHGQTLSVLPIRVEALLGKFPLFYKVPVLLGYFIPKYAETIIIHVKKINSL